MEGAGGTKEGSWLLQRESGRWRELLEGSWENRRLWELAGVRGREGAGARAGSWIEGESLMERWTQLVVGEEEGLKSGEREMKGLERWFLKAERKVVGD